MQLAPNKTPIKATVIDVLNEGDTLTVVILDMPTEITLPAFLNVGKIVVAKNLSISNGIVFNKGDIISTNIEVMGDPFKQSYLLHDVIKSIT